jgi:predicted RNA-binding protein with PUA-like domain
MFVCNPKKWAIDRFFEAGIDKDTWGVRLSDAENFKPGHLALIRVGVDRRSKSERQDRPPLVAGIYALCIVESETYPGKGANDIFWSPGEKRAPGWPTVNIRYLKKFLAKPLSINRLKTEQPTLSPHILNGLQASSFPISANDFKMILMMLGEDSQAFQVLESSNELTSNRLQELEERYRDAVPEVLEVLSRRIERGPIGNSVKRANGFRCQLCEALGNNPIGFYKPDGEPYVEAHHVIPVSQGHKGLLSASNVVTVCANHHRQLHFGSVEVKIENDYFQFQLPQGEVVIQRFYPKIENA